MTLGTNGVVVVDVPWLFIVWIAWVPEVGLEPTRPFEQRILSPSRLPFRHSGQD